MTETILAGKQVKKFPLGNAFTFLATPDTIVPGFPEDFFVGNRPRNAGNRYGQQK